MLRPATDDDVEIVRGWRNHIDVRRSSFTTHEIGPGEHLEWWRRTSRDPNRHLLVMERFGIPSGVVTFDGPNDSGVVEWGFYLDLVGLGERGETLPAWLQVEREAIDYAFETLAAEALEGEVIGGNEAVLRLHWRHGFREISQETRMRDGSEVVVIRIGLQRADWRSRAQKKVTE